MHKVCPVVLRKSREILAFQHPNAGLQFVKGGIEDGEASDHAAERELYEESGLTLCAENNLGQRTDIAAGDTWHFWLMQRGSHPDQWRHQTTDDEGHVFDFFWLPLDTPPPSGFAAPYVRAFNHIAQAMI